IVSMTGLPSGFFAPGTCPRGFRFFSGMKASSSMKASASVRMMPFTAGLNQLADTPATDSRRRSRMVTSASAFEPGRRREQRDGRLVERPVEPPLERVLSEEEGLQPDAPAGVGPAHGGLVAHEVQVE